MTDPVSATTDDASDEPAAVEAGVAKKDPGVFKVFDAVLAAEPLDVNPWLAGRYTPDQALLERLFQDAISAGGGITQQSGRAASSLDAWIAHELRRAGFPSDDVWPRPSEPRVLPGALGPLAARLETVLQLLERAEQSGDWGSNLKSVKSGPANLTPGPLRNAIMGLRKDLPGGGMRESRLLGRFYTKQVDVLVSSWQHGPDVIVSTKTMFSSYNNNRNNRYEETLGEATNLRDRYPLAAMGYVFLLRQDVHNPTDPDDVTFRRMHDLISRLRKPDGPYDATMLLIGDWDPQKAELHHVDTDPSAPTLGSGQFFADIINAVLDRTPFDEHRELRRRREAGSA